MKHEPRIAAMAPWHWFSRSSPRSPEFALGAKEFPALVAALEAFGRDLKRNNSATTTTVPTTAKKIKTDDATTAPPAVAPWVPVVGGTSCGRGVGDGKSQRPEDMQLHDK